MMIRDTMTSRPRLDESSFPTLPKAKVDVLSSRLNELSMKDRDEALQDLHGVGDLVEENEVMVKAKLSEMQYALLSSIARMPPDESKAYRKAVSLCPAYVDKMKIVFLRSESFQVPAAAVRMIKFFGLKKELFGEDKLVQNITQKDLGKEEQDLLKQGLIHLLPHRDRAGRVIVFCNGNINCICEKHETAQRVIFYFITSILQEAETQIKGLVGIYYAIGQKRIVQGRFQALVKMSKSLPWRISGRHLCRDDDTKFEFLVRYFVKNVESRYLCRFRVHSGSRMECIYNLMTFGVPREALPINDDGTIDLTDHHRVVRTLQWREEGNLPSKTPTSGNAVPDDSAAGSRETEAALVPGPMDILMGRGHQPMCRPGLLRMHNLLLEHMDAYDTASRNTRVNVAKVILQELRKSGCRFLTGKDGGFVLCSDAAAIEKISHGFRNLRMKRKKGTAGYLHGGVVQTTRPTKRVLAI